MTRRCRLLLVLGCWILSALIAPDTWESIGSKVPSTFYASAQRVGAGALGAEVQLAERPRRDAGRSGPDAPDSAVLAQHASHP